MKKILLALLAFSAFGGFAQISEINEVGSFNLQNSGAILDKNHDVDGYYFYYVGDKLNKGEREFAIQIFDKNLTEVAKKTYISEENTFLMKSSFNNAVMMFAVANYKDKEINLLTYDKQANQRETYTIPLSTREMMYIQLIQDVDEFNILFAIENKGFLFNKIVQNKKIGYSLKYFPTDGGLPWEYNSPEDSKAIHVINPIEVNDKVIVTMETSIPSLLSNKITTKTKVLEAMTGKLLFEREYSKYKQPRLVTNAFLNSDNSLVLMGEYFEEGSNIVKDQSIGLFTEVLDITGKTIKESFVSWAVDVAKLLNVKSGSSKISDKGYIYFHDIIKTGNNEFYAIGEYYQTSGTQMTIGDAVVFKFNSDFELTAVQEFEKGNSNVPKISVFASPQINAHYLSSSGSFDYEYTQTDRVNDRFYSCFIDYERVKGDNKSAFKTIIYDEGELTEDKISLTHEGKNFRVFPGKMGNVLLVEYDEKAKTILMHLEKLNIK